MKKVSSLNQELVPIMLNYVHGIEYQCSSERITNYFESFIKLTNEKNKNKLDIFLAKLIELISKDSTPFLDLNTLLLLYKRYEFYPNIFLDINYLVNNLKVAPSKEFIAIVIQFTGIFKRSFKEHKKRLYLLCYILNKGIVDENELIKKPNSLNILFDLKINEINFLELKNKVNDSTSHFAVFFYHLNLAYKNNLSTLEIDEMIKNHFSLSSYDNNFNQVYKSFLDILYQKLPVNFMSTMNFINLRKLFFIYKINSEIFKSWVPVYQDKLDMYQLIKSLFTDFIISDIFIRNFSYDNLTDKERKWFSFVLNGNNLVNAENLPCKLTRKAAHLFRCMTHKSISVTNALIACSLQSLTQDLEFSLTVANRIRNVNYAQYWIDSMSIIYAKKVYFLNTIEIMDYLDYKVIQLREKVELKNKKIQNLMTDIRVWHDELREIRISKLNKRKFPDSGIEDQVLEFQNHSFEIKQIRNSLDLYLEGVELSHCVYSYRQYCMFAKSYIFSLALKTDEVINKKLITIELKGSEIVQVRGKHNRYPNEIEKTIINMWSRENKLKFVS